jgi:hypothetical protein
MRNFPIKRNFAKTKTKKMKGTLMVSGDNTNGVIWCADDVEVSPIFVEATEFPFKDKIPLASRISAYKQSIAFTFSDNQIVFQDAERKLSIFETGIIKQICCAENTVYALCFDKKIYDCAAKTCFEGSDYIQISNSDNIFCALKADGSVFEFKDGKPKKILNEGGRYIGCTNEDIFIVRKESVKRYAEETLYDVHSSGLIVSISTSLSEAAFIDVDGNVFVYDSDSLIQVFGLPPIVYCSVGVQHFAAISFDGCLYTWGFNPSGQLGIGSDRPTNDPYLVLEDVRLVACGTHNTVAITGGKPETPENMNVSKMKRKAPSHSAIRSSSSKIEIQK